MNIQDHSRSRLRKTLRSARRKLPRELQQHAAQRICDTLITDSIFLRSKHIAFYMAVDGEISPDRIALLAENRGKSCYLPLVSDFIRPWESTRLLFQPFSPATIDLEPNQYGILEPQSDPRYAVEPAMLDLVVVPLVAFDSTFNRLGMGKGYYDRTFGKALKWRRPKLLGLAYSSQQVEHLESTNLDVPIDGMLTEEGLLWK
ncbi:MAG: 5-formyltetrahydrofolate cyclo-ligase [Candidatus Azotimanducaceae bacterium]|jgi:5-formyltetrahydrofolate cyclo-ligase